MALDSNICDAVRIHVIQHCSVDGTSQCCKFSVDPRLTTLTVLHNLVARAFKLCREFETSYLARDERLPEAVWLPLLSDFDLELAFTRSSEPHLLVKVEFGRSGSGSSGGSLELLPRLPLPDMMTANNYGTRLPGLFREKMEKTIGLMQKALNWPDELSGGAGEGGAGSLTGVEGGTGAAPLDDARFQSFLDSVGVLHRVHELRHAVYLVGLEPSLRKVAWRHLLDVYPEGLTGKQRLDYMQTKTQEYYALRDSWQRHLQRNGPVCEEVLSISNMVRKDVLRTDRHHPYFSGPDDNANTTALYNILTTYSLNHPSVGYCQGMSDLASPLLVTQRNEAYAYVCFCALMSRAHPNFHIDGVAMSLKFQHLSEALVFYDPDFYVYLQEHQADDLLFCYRWLLLELKREFAFDDAQLMLEVLWASLPPRPPEHTLPLCEVSFDPEAALQASLPAAPVPAPPPPVANPPRLLSRRISNYRAVCALRRQRSREAASLLFGKGRLAVLERVRSHTAGARVLSSVRGEGRENGPAKGEKSGVQGKEEASGSGGSDVPPLSDGAGGAVAVGDDTDVNVTPTRKIKNLKEFMELGRNMKTPSNPSSPSKSPSKKANSSPIRSNAVTKPGSCSLSDNLTHSDTLINSNKVINLDSSQFSSSTFVDVSIPNHIPRPKDIFLSADNSSHSDVREFNCSPGDVKDLPPSGLTPIESPCESALESSCLNSCADGGCDVPSAACLSNTSCQYSRLLTGKCKVEFSSGYSTLSKTRNSFSLENSNVNCCSHDALTSPGDEFCSSVSPSNRSSCSSVLCSTDTQRRCFSESDAGLGMLLDGEDHPTADDEELCVEVWENPVASSPIRSIEEKQQQLQGSNTEGDLAKLASVREVRNSQQVRYVATGGIADCGDGAGTKYTNSNPVFGSTAGTGWSVSLGGSSGTTKLPPPAKFGGGNPFLMIVCVTILLQHRHFIISQQLDHNDLAMHFDKMVRKHNVHGVLRQARLRYQHYCSLHGAGGSSSHEAC